MNKNLQSKINDKTAVIGIIGLGYVGLPLAVEFANNSFTVIGIDVNKERVDQLNRGDNYIADVSDNNLKKIVSSKKLSVTTDFSVITKIDAVIICVPTPLNKLKDPDVSYILNVLDQLTKYVHTDMLISLESTTYPGTTRELILPALEKMNLIAGEDFSLCFSPERVDPGNEKYQIKNTPKVIGGITEKCTKIGKLLYESIIDIVVPVSSPEAAETVKLLENTFRSINIGLANEVAIMCEKLGVDVWEVIDAAATKPFGFMKFTPGPGLGGHCIPIDPHYLAWKMKTLDYRARFIELAGEINTGMPLHVLDLISSGLNRFQKAINGSKILVLGIAYKKDIDDVRESPALDVMTLLEQGGAQVDYYDDFVPKISWNDNYKYSENNLTAETLHLYDAVVVLTDHSNIDFDLVKLESKLIIDTRNVFSGVKDSKIIRLGNSQSK
ncbi:MAG: nucleotide sugar dehydrogenase [Candidatus Marinimicrobia bacterium]|nr:nucleotide sugar dehydrogenase [Candidatus Neomarinimicrobiota bacterium]